MRYGEGPWKPVADALPPPPGESGIRLLASRGLLRPGLVAAHCVTVDDEEIALLAEHGVAVVHCPRSNALLGCGIAPLRKLLDAGLTVGLGTDSPASTPSFDMFEELRAAVFFARAREQRADALTATEALELATHRLRTRARARRRGRDARAGQAAPTSSVVSLEGSPFLPWEDPAAAVVLGGTPGRVAATLVGGEVRYERGAFDWHELRRRGTSARNRLLAAESQRLAAEAKSTRRGHPEWEQDLFFGRMRRKTKWVFAFLAVVFALSFVFLGVGSGGSALTDILNGNIHLFGSGGGPSIQSLEKNVAKNPTDPKARLKLANALKTKSDRTRRRSHRRSRPTRPT